MGLKCTSQPAWSKVFLQTLLWKIWAQFCLPILIQQYENMSWYNTENTHAVYNQIKSL